MQFHVVATIDGKWSIVADGRSKGIKNFSTERGAISFAKKSLKGGPGRIIIHNKRGGVKSVISGN
jgi:hypothetical protein